MEVLSAYGKVYMETQSLKGLMCQSPVSHFAGVNQSFTVLCDNGGRPVNIFLFRPAGLSSVSREGCRTWWERVLSWMLVLWRPRQLAGSSKPLLELPAPAVELYFSKNQLILEHFIPLLVSSS